MQPHDRNDTLAVQFYSPQITSNAVTFYVNMGSVREKYSADEANLRSEVPGKAWQTAYCTVPHAIYWQCNRASKLKFMLHNLRVRYEITVLLGVLEHYE